MFQDQTKAAGDWRRYTCPRCGGSLPSCCFCPPAETKSNQLITLTRQELAELIAEAQRKLDTDSEYERLAEKLEKEIERFIEAQIERGGVNV